jgi:protoporphyrinogen oxidase
MRNPILVLGAGIAGLGAAYKLSGNNQQVIVLEKDETYGGFAVILLLKDFVLTVLYISLLQRMKKLMTFSQKVALKYIVINPIHLISIMVYG